MLKCNFTSKKIEVSLIGSRNVVIQIGTAEQHSPPGRELLDAVISGAHVDSTALRATDCDTC